MKTLYLIRHAKSSWNDGSLDDIDRPLNERGNTDAPKMGQYLHQKKVMPDALISSPANRAYTTATLIAQQIGFDPKQISIEPLLYTFTIDVGELVHFIQLLPDELDTVMLFGHNPTFTELANFFTHNHFFLTENPTCSVVGIELQSNTWKNANAAAAQLSLYAFPKML